MILIMRRWLRSCRKRSFPPMTVWSWTFERMLLMAGCMQKMFDIADMNPYITPHRGHSSAGRALEWHSRGQRFDPAWLHQLNHAITSSLITPTKRDCDNFVPYAEELFLKAMPLHLWAAIGSPSFIANGAISPASCFSEIIPGIRPS